MVLGIVISFIIGTFVGFMIFAILSLAKEYDRPIDNERDQHDQGKEPEELND